MEQGQPPIYPFMLTMSVDSDNEWESEYRIRLGNKVKYLTIAAATFFDYFTMMRPLDSLPSMLWNDDNWNVAYISRDPESGELRTSLSVKQLAGVENVWHSVQIDVLDLEMESLTCLTYEVVVRETTDSATEKVYPFPPPFKAIAKIARFEWEIPYIEQETRAYQVLHQKDPTIAPRLLGHIREGDRVIGLLIEKIEGRRRASIGDLHKCEKALERFHNLGLLHGDVNRYNFLVGDDDVKLIDFEGFTEDPTEEEKLLEMQSLPAELVEESGRGAGHITVIREEDEENEGLKCMGDKSVEGRMPEFDKKAEETD